MKRVLILSLLIGVIFISGCIDQNASPSGTQGTTTTTLTKSVIDMLPSRAEIPTVFTIDETKDVTTNATGFESGKLISTSKLEGSTGMIWVDYSVYKFSTSGYARAFYDSRINEIKQGGGYEEISISGCFAFKEDYGFENKFGTSICLKNNVVYIVDATASRTYKGIDSFLKDATTILANKV
jgi:hypothetical protein